MLKLQGFESLTNLVVLDLSNNRIQELPSLQALAKLTVSS